jgi:hypothetical protein
VPTLTGRDNTFVYLITDGKFCKIGFAKNLKVRLCTLQNATPHDLRIVDAIETDQPRALEAFLHGLFANKHHRNEWFKRITIEEWKLAVDQANSILSTAISSAFPSMQQEVLNNTSI